MSEYIETKKFLNKLGINYEEKKIISIGKETRICLLFNNRMEKVNAYEGFECSFDFDTEGNFIEIEIGEC